ncbi:MAG: amino acid ABC transporter ATP-binding protein [Desulfurococcales archaeon]|nr:amino acid ABC transporter ATP-binding protein [Desulfurococcales archaeon]
MSLLSLEGVKAAYDGVEVLHGITLSLEPSERLVIMGPSGSGKSTLLKVIPRLIEPSGGRIFFDGLEITAIRDERLLRRVRSRIGYLPQHYGLFPHMTVLGNVAFPLRVVRGLPRREAEERARRYLALFGVDGLADRYPTQLSGGQRQRVALARALAMEPELLLLDEPTSALDPESRLDVLEALFEVARMGKSMIIVTHELDFALEAADRLAFMEAGRVVAVGGPGEVLDSNPRIREFAERMAGAVGSASRS